MTALQHIVIFFALILGVSRHDSPMLVSAQFEFGAAFETNDASSSLSSVVAPDNTGTFVLGGATSTEGDGDPTPNQIIKAFLDDFDHRADGEFPGLMEKKWTYYTNLTEENRQIKVEAQIRITRFDSEARQTAQTYYHTYPSHQISYDIRRELEAVASTSGSPKYVNEVTQELEDVKSRMEQRYHTAQVCRKKRGRRARQECLPLDPDLKRVMGESRDDEELLWAWQGWRNETGAPNRDDFQRFVELSNTVAEQSGFDDHGDLLRREYNMPHMENTMSDLLTDLQPLYNNLHAFIRRRLYDIHGPEVIDLDGPIPSHLLGGMWSHSWSNLFDVAKPYDVDDDDPTQFLQEQNYDVRRLYETAEDFYTSMGFEELPESFWENSVFGKPKDGRNVSCEPTSWDFHNQTDFRVSTCSSEVTIDELSRAHNILGHTQYQNSYSHHPIAFREPASPALFEALADLTSSEVFSPAYLRQLGLPLDEQNDEKIQLNGLMRTALDSLALLPYASAVDQWRWGVFNGSIQPEQYNSKWWKLRSNYEGIVPPLERTEADFDPGAELNIISDNSYAKHFLGQIMKFQFIKSLCQAAGHTGPIQDCNLYGNRVAGQLITTAMQLGKTRSWTEIFYILTQQYDLDTSPFLEYFQPLNEFLERENRRNGDSTGWALSARRRPDQTPGRTEPSKPSDRM
ncbi:angiotensin-converting enzyme-like [Lytechinus variegatus]|uniref:angiotensin-converting enzyme-like n=1 Tax=Lytechinus variegatus TaxID=7654 RepID=UPI001BB11363|nr:angiotensin-converting enzyme-like [Lytechinus variegatus]